MSRKVYDSEESILEGFDVVSEDGKCFWGHETLSEGC